MDAIQKKTVKPQNKISREEKKLKSNFCIIIKKNYVAWATHREILLIIFD